MERGRVALTAGIALLQILGALAPLLPGRSGPFDASRVHAAHEERHAAGVARAARHERPAGAPCHDVAPIPQRSDLDPILAARCPCGCGGLPSNVVGHSAGSGPVLLASAPALAGRPARGRFVPPTDRLPAPPTSRVDHVPISA